MLTVYSSYKLLYQPQLIVGGINTVEHDNSGKSECSIRSMLCDRHVFFCAIIDKFLQFNRGTYLHEITH